MAKKGEIPWNFAPVCNFLLEALAAHPLTGLELRVLLLIMRDTYGWSSNGKSKRRLDRNKIPIWSDDAGQLTKTLVGRTGASDKGVREALKRLIALGIVIVYQKPAGKAPGVYGINSKIDEWGGGRQGVVVEKAYPKGAEREATDRNQSTGQVQPSRPEPEYRTDRNQSTGQHGTRVPDTEEPEYRTSEAQTQTAERLEAPLRKYLKKALKRNPLKKGVGRGGFEVISSSLEAKLRTDLCAEQAAEHAAEYLLSVWTEPCLTESHVEDLTFYFSNDRTPPCLLLANSIDAVDETVARSEMNALAGLNRFKDPLDQSIKAMKARLAERLRKRRPQPVASSPGSIEAPVAVGESL